MENDNLLVAQSIGGDQYVGVNTGKTIHQGIDFLANYSWVLKYFTVSPSFSAAIGSYKFVEFNYRDNDFSRNDLNAVPANKVTAGVRFETNSSWCFLSNFLFLDKMPLNDANSVYADAYRLINLKTVWTFTIFNKLTSEISAKINNVANEKYASLVLPNATAFGNAQPRYYYPGLPVNYYRNVAIRYAF
jgi:iron complex outermembrane receptor protein